MKHIFFTLFFIAFVFAQQKRLIEFVHNGTQVWLTEKQIEELMGIPGQMTSFIDITDSPFLVPIPLKQTSFPVQPSQQEIVRPLIEEVDANSEQNLLATVRHLSSYTTRHANSATGVQAAEWIYSQYKSIIDALPKKRREKFSVEFFNHTQWRQPSIIARIQGTSDELVIIGGHEDSIAPRSNTAPGADDGKLQNLLYITNL